MHLFLNHFYSVLIFKLLQKRLFSTKQAENSSRSHGKEITVNLRFHKFCILYKKSGLVFKETARLYEMFAHLLVCREQLLEFMRIEI